MLPDADATTPPGGDAAALGPGLLSEQVHRRLRASIVAGELAPGARLVESEIARRWGVSQAPVREAIRQLNHEGLVRTVPRRGSTVAEVSAADAGQARRVRVALEALAAREAVAAWGPGAERDLRAVVERMRTAAADGDPAALRQADLAFHRRVAEIGGNTFLLRAWAQLETSFFLLQVLGDPFRMGDLDTAVAWHADLVAVLAGGDADAAAVAFTHHAEGRPDPPRT